MAPAPLTQLRHRPPLLPTLLATAAAALLAAIVGLILGLSALVLAGATTRAVASDSMVPLFRRGDLVVTRPLSALQVGDVVTFRKYGQLVTHRIVALGRTAGSFETRGDANPGNDPWTITATDVTGRVIGVVPNLGHVLLATETALGRLLIVNGLLALLFAAAWAVPRATRIPARLLHPSAGHAIA